MSISELLKKYQDSVTDTGGALTLCVEPDGVLGRCNDAEDRALMKLLSSLDARLSAAEEALRRCVKTDREDVTLQVGASLEDIGS